MSDCENHDFLLMTATIHPRNVPYANAQNPQERLKQYLYSLISWIILTNIKNIIFCENSNTNYDFGRIKKLAKDYDKNLDIIIFDGNQKTSKYGKGWGESKIIEYAFQNSKILDTNSSFYKVTGRYFVKNFQEIQEKHINIPIVFTQQKISPQFLDYLFDYSNCSTSIDLLKKTWQSSKLYLFYLRRGYLFGRPNPNFRINTIFFKAQVDFFEKYLLKSHRIVDDRYRYVLEKVYSDILKDRDFSPFLTPFQLTSYNSTDRKTDAEDGYSDSIHKMVRDFL